MPERFECTTLAKKAYINTLPFLSFHMPKECGSSKGCGSITGDEKRRRNLSCHTSAVCGSHPLDGQQGRRRVARSSDGKD